MASTLNKSEFAKWFKAQFGRLPNHSRLLRLREQHAQAERREFSLRADLLMEERLHNSFNDALYAWNARK